MLGPVDRSLVVRLLVAALNVGQLRLQGELVRPQRSGWALLWLVLNWLIA